MGKKKASKDRHRPHRMVRLDVPLYLALGELARRSHRTISQELRRLLEEELTRERLWPPHPPASP